MEIFKIMVSESIPTMAQKTKSHRQKWSKLSPEQQIVTTTAWSDMPPDKRHTLKCPPMLGGGRLLHALTDKILGRQIGFYIHKSPAQISITLNKARAAASRLHTYAGTPIALLNMDVTRMLYSMLVQSAITAGTTHTQLSSSDVNSLRKIQAKIWRRWSAAGRHCNHRALLHELGQVPIDAHITYSKMNLWSKILDLQQHEYPRIIAEQRIIDAEKGSTLGLAAETKMLWEEAKQPDLWDSAHSDLAHTASAAKQILRSTRQQLPSRGTDYG